MPRYVQNLVGVGVIVVLLVAPVWYAFHYDAQVRNFHVVREGVLYRSGQTTVDGLKLLIHDYHIKTIVTLRDALMPGDPPPDLDEERFCAAQEINHYRIRPEPWWAAVGPPPVEEGVRTFREVMANPDNYPVLVHCCAGIHRTGAYCAIYRMEQDHWTNAQAIAEMMAYGYTNLPDEWDIRWYLENYRPTWAAPREEKEVSDPRPPLPTSKKRKTRSHAHGAK